HVRYEAQDWVEQSIFINYQGRVDADGGGTAPPYGDRYYPGQFYDQPDGGGYNHFVRYPGTDMYVNNWVPQLANQWKWLKVGMNNAGPKAVTIWQKLIEDNNLGDYGFEYNKGSTQMDSDAIIAYAEGYWNLKSPKQAPGPPQVDGQFGNTNG